MNIKIIIQTSGILECLGCTSNEFLDLYKLYLRGFVTEGMREDLDNSGVVDFIETMFKMSSLESAIRIFKKAEKEADDYMLEIDVKKSAGTYDDWYQEIKEENKRNLPVIKAFFHEFSTKVKPIKSSNFLN